MPLTAAGLGNLVAGALDDPRGRPGEAYSTRRARAFNPADRTLDPDRWRTIAFVEGLRLGRRVASATGPVYDRYFDARAA